MKKPQSDSSFKVQIIKSKEHLKSIKATEKKQVQVVILEI